MVDLLVVRRALRPPTFRPRTAVRAIHRGALFLAGDRLRSGHWRYYRYQSTTVTPMLRAVPAMIFMAASMSRAFKSGILISAICRS